jgi:hypothetical protein
MKTNESKSDGQKIDTAPSALKVYGPAGQCETAEQARAFLDGRVKAVMEEENITDRARAEELERFRIINYANMWEPWRVNHRVKKLFKAEPTSVGATVTESNKR